MNKKNRNVRGALILAVLPPILMLGGCIQLNPAGSEDLARGAASAGTVTAADRLSPPSAAVAQSAGKSPTSSLSGFEREKRRKVASVLAFFGLQPGLTVLDLYSPGGYYTEQLSSVVGNAGSVVSYSSPPDQGLAPSVEIENSYVEGRYANLVVIPKEDDEFLFPPGFFDLVLMIRVFHDLYEGDVEMGGSGVDVQTILARTYRSMRPGAVLGIVDNIAEKGAPASTGRTLHRIDPDRIKRDVIAAGFLFDGESEILRSYNDDYAQPVFTDSVRDRTDRVVLKFRKPVR